MSGQEAQGGTAVGLLDALAPMEAAAVAYLRLWCDGPETRPLVWNDFAVLLGPAQGRGAVGALERLCVLCVRHGRRPLMRHQVDCRCLGADEACFANFVATAASGDRDDALWLASMMVRAEIAPLLVSEAQQLGLALRRMALRAKAAEPTPHRDTPRHLH